MGFTFRPARRENVHAIIGLGGGTGSGKTMSAMRMAAGIVDAMIAAGLTKQNRFAVIDTEAGRANHYADHFDFDHGDLKAPFAPDAYGDAITAAADAGYPVVVVDSMSHEHAGEGGLLDWFETDWAKGGHSESKKASCWIKPKTAHKAFVQKILQLRAHLILCYRAEEKLILQPKEGEKKYEMHWRPVLARGLEFEMLASFLLHHETPGLPSDPLKLPEALKRYFDPKTPIDENTGRGIAEWSAGGKPDVSRQLADALAVIAAARTKEELTAVGIGLADADLGKADANVARKAFKARGTELSS